LLRVVRFFSEARSFVWMFAVCIVAALLRLYVMAHLGPMLDELKLIQEIIDLRGPLVPVHFYGFGWGENTLLAFLAWPFMRFLHAGGLATIRGLVFTANMVSIILLYRVTLLFFHRRVALVTTVFSALWPWSILVGSVGFNVFILQPFVLGAILLLYRYVRTRRTMLLYGAAAMLAITAYGYELMLVWVPILAILWYFCNRKHVRLSALVGPAFLGVVIAFPIALFHLQAHLNYYFVDHLFFFSYPHLRATRYDGIAITGIYGGASLIGHYLFNYFAHFVFIFLAFSPLYYYASHDVFVAVLNSGAFFITDPLFYLLAPQNGLYFSSLSSLWDPFLILFALYLLTIKKTVFQNRMFFFGWFLLYPLIPSFVNGDYVGYNLTRDIIGLPVLLMLSAFGAVSLLEKAQKEFKEYRERKAAQALLAQVRRG